MSHIKERVTNAKNFKEKQIGWYSEESVKNGSSIYIYTLEDSNKEVRLTSVAKSSHNKPAWKDAKCIGIVNRYLRTEKSKKLNRINTLLIE